MYVACDLIIRFYRQSMCYIKYRWKQKLPKRKPQWLSTQPSQAWSHI